jgi:DnaK suppressor protein
MNALTSEQLEELRLDLSALRKQLERSLDSSLEATRPVDLDQPIGRISRMDAIQQQNMAQATRQAAEMRMKQADSALRRIGIGEYGLCLECEDDVGYARLKARPEALLCVACQETRETQ